MRNVPPRTYTQTVFQPQWNTIAGPSARAGDTAPPEKAAAADTCTGVTYTDTQWENPTPWEAYYTFNAYVQTLQPV